jgi:hypothetical protein
MMAPQLLLLLTQMLLLRVLLLVSGWSLLLLLLLLLPPGHWRQHMRAVCGAALWLLQAPNRTQRRRGLAARRRARCSASV